jgi:cation diffusion facilitator family transporter
VTSGADEKSAAVRRVVLVVLVLNVLVAGSKFVVAAMTGSLAIATDAVHSLLDAASNVVGMVALRLAHSPPDAEHPYGHGKIEILAAAGIGVIIGVATFEFGAGAIKALYQGGGTSTAPAAGFAVVIGTLVVNLGVSLYEHRRGKALGSTFLTADAAHTASDVVVTAGVLLSLVLTRLGFAWADAVCALAVTVVIGRVAVRILRENSASLLDRAVLPVDEVRTIALGVGGVTDCHRVRSRGVGGQAMLDLHITVDGDLPLARAHGLAHEVETRLRARWSGLVDVVIHVEPDGDEAEEL